MLATLLYLSAVQQQTSTLTRQNFYFFYGKFSAERHVISCFFVIVSGSGQKMAKTKVVQKNANWRRSETMA